MAKHYDVYQDAITSNWGWSQRLITELAQKLQPRWTVRGLTSTAMGVLENAQGDTIDINILKPFRELDRPGWLVTDVVHARPGVKTVMALYPEVFHFYAVDFDLGMLQQPSKLYNCFIHRGCAFRQSWMYQLIRQNLLDHGHVTYWCHDVVNLHQSPEQTFENLFQGNEIFAAEHAALRSRIPFKNFDCPLEQAIIDSQKSLVLETFFEDNAVCLSEKTWRAVQLPRPFLLFACPGSVAMLRDWGFDVYDDMINHAYDHETDPVRRQMAILAELGKALTFDHNTLTDLNQRARHNQTLLRNLGLNWQNRVSDIVKALD